MDEHKKWLNNFNPNLGNYISGFTDGEGSFNVSLKKREDYKNSWKLSPSFNISQKDRVILALFKKELGFGTLRERKDGIVYYEVTNIEILQKRVIPFFKKFHFLSANKKKNFYIFANIINLIYKKEHLQQDGFKKILELREKLNFGIGRTRKYNIQDVIKK
ncbi:MAG: LAGLIDADG family homing endonuclease [Patescibacteria group bacterium]